MLFPSLDNYFSFQIALEKIRPGLSASLTEAGPACWFDISLQTPHIICGVGTRNDGPLLSLQASKDVPSFLSWYTPYSKGVETIFQDGGGKYKEYDSFILRIVLSSRSSGGFTLVLKNPSFLSLVWYSFSLLRNDVQYEGLCCRSGYCGRWR